MPFINEIPENEITMSHFADKIVQLVSFNVSRYLSPLKRAF